MPFFIYFFCDLSCKEGERKMRISHCSLTYRPTIISGRRPFYKEYHLYRQVEKDNLSVCILRYVALGAT